MNHLREALGVPLALSLAGTRGASSGALPALTTTLAVERSTGLSARGRSSSGGLGGRGSRGLGLLGSRAEGAADGANLDVAVDDLGVGAVLLEVGGFTGGDSACTASNTRGGGALVSGEGRVEPKHVDGMVVPNGESEDHSTANRATHSLQATKFLELVLVTEGLLLRIAVGSRDTVTGNASDLAHAVVNDLAVLDVLAADLSECTTVSAVVGDELSDNGELGLGVDSLAGAVERSVTLAVAVEIASILVTDTVVTVVAVTALETGAALGAVYLDISE